MDSGPEMQCILPLKFFVLFMPIVRPCPVVFILIIFVTSMIPSQRVMFFPLPFRGHNIDSKQSNKRAQPTPVAISFNVISLDRYSIIWLMRYELAFAKPTGRQRCTALVDPMHYPLAEARSCTLQYWHRQQHTVRALICSVHNVNSYSSFNLRPES